MKQDVVFDGRNVYSLDKMNELGFYYESMGRKTIHPELHNNIEIPQSTIVRDRGVHND